MSLDLKMLKQTFGQIDKIVTPEYTKFLLQHGDDPLPRWVVDIISELLRAQPRDRSGSFSSSSATACERAQVLGFLGMPGTSPDAQLANIFLDGKWRHLRWQAILLAAGVLSEVEYSLTWPAKRSVGTMDGLGVVSDKHPNPRYQEEEFGFELKGVSTFQFSSRVKEQYPLEEHCGQVARYFISGGFKLFSVIYEDKTTQAFHEWVLDAEDPYIQKLMREQQAELERLNKAVKTKVLPNLLPECSKMKGPTFEECWFGGKYGPCWKYRQDAWPRLKGS